MSGVSSGGTVDSPAMRVGDAEREACAAQIREHYAAGRLTHEEMTERLESALSARTAADLAPLVQDLPTLPAPVRRAGVWAAAWRHWAATSVIVWAIWGVGEATSGGHQGLWPLWVSGPWGAVILSRWLRFGQPRRGRRR
jgi:hypothetical protein